MISLVETRRNSRIVCQSNRQTAVKHTAQPQNSEKYMITELSADQKRRKKCIKKKWSSNFVFSLKEVLDKSSDLHTTKTAQKNYLVLVGEDPVVADICKHLADN